MGSESTSSDRRRGGKRGLGRARRRHLRHPAQRAGDAPGGHRPAGRPPRRAPRAPRPGPRSPAAAPSRGSRRAPAGPARARSARRSGGAAAWPSGPSPAATRQRTPKKMIRLALRSALSDRAADGKVVVVDEWGFDAPKTKDAVAALDRARASRAGCCVVLGRERRGRLAELPQPRPTSTACCAGELNAYDVLVRRLGGLHHGTLPTDARREPCDRGPSATLRSPPKQPRRAIGRPPSGTSAARTSSRCVTPAT